MSLFLLLSLLCPDATPFLTSVHTVQSWSKSVYSSLFLKGVYQPVLQCQSGIRTISTRGLPFIQIKGSCKRGQDGSPVLYNCQSQMKVYYPSVKARSPLKPITLLCEMISQQTSKAQFSFLIPFLAPFRFAVGCCTTALTYSVFWLQTLGQMRSRVRFLVTLFHLCICLVLQCDLY